VSVMIVKIGQVRRRAGWWAPDTYEVYDSKDEVIVADESVYLALVEEYAYKYPALRKDLGWQRRGWELVTPQPVRVTPLPTPSMWSRLRSALGTLFGRARIAQARALAAGVPNDQD